MSDLTDSLRELYANEGHAKCAEAADELEKFDQEYSQLTRVNDRLAQSAATALADVERGLNRIAALEADLTQAVQMYTDAAGERDKALADLAAAQQDKGLTELAMRQKAERLTQCEEALAAAQAKIAGNAELIGKFVKAAADAEAEAAALRALLLRATRWVRGIDSTANDVELSQLKRDLDAAIEARKEG